MSVLGTYLKYRLIAICDLTDLRNKMCLHSKFLQSQAAKNHFDKVMNMHSENDLKMLDLNMAYNLLVNFCDIPDPLREWGIIPDIDDVSQGADIERIKMIVNDYFDGYYCKHANADEIIKRWTEDYGEIPLCDVINLNQESKINCKYIYKISQLLSNLHSISDELSARKAYNIGTVICEEGNLK